MYRITRMLPVAYPEAPQMYRLKNKGKKKKLTCSECLYGIVKYPGWLQNNGIIY